MEDGIFSNEIMGRNNRYNSKNQSSIMVVILSFLMSRALQKMVEINGNQLQCNWRLLYSGDCYTAIKLWTEQTKQNIIKFH